MNYFLPYNLSFKKEGLFRASPLYTQYTKIPPHIKVRELKSCIYGMCVTSYCTAPQLTKDGSVPPLGPQSKKLYYVSIFSQNPRGI
tara:strand:- start:672 stop:929 length:258 start_codon:yes stop_codon:yes gene_type:complete